MNKQQLTNNPNKTFILSFIIKLGGFWSAFFAPMIIALFAFIIPFTNASTRTFILRLMSMESGKVFLLLAIVLPIWYGLNRILTLLADFNIYPKRGRFLITLLALAWTAHAIYVLFMR